MEQNFKSKEVIENIITEAWENETFKNSLIENPRATIEEFTGKSLSTDKNIEVVDQTNGNTIYINIPEQPNMEDVELSEEQLDIVSGGDGGFWDAARRGNGLDYLAWKLGLISVDD